MLITLASVWDIIAVTIIPSITGVAWASQWVYISFDSLGAAHHSIVWLNYNLNRWAWIGNSPIEITPWFSIAGWVFIYSLAQVFDTKKKIS